MFPIETPAPLAVEAFERALAWLRDCGSDSSEHGEGEDERDGSEESADVDIEPTD